MVRKVIWIDSDAFDFRPVWLFLKRHEVEVICSESVADGIKALKSHEAFLKSAAGATSRVAVLLDAMVPIGDADNAVRNHDVFKQTGGIGVTGHAVLDFVDRTFWLERLIVLSVIDETHLQSQNFPSGPTFFTKDALASKGEWDRFTKRLLKILG